MALTNNTYSWVRSLVRQPTILHSYRQPRFVHKHICQMNNSKLQIYDVSHKHILNITITSLRQLRKNVIKLKTRGGGGGGGEGQSLFLSPSLAKNLPSLFKVPVLIPTSETSATSSLSSFLAKLLFITMQSTFYVQRWRFQHSPWNA